MRTKRHTPVFAQAVISVLKPDQNSKIIDGTVGEGGHLRLLIEQGAQVLGMDYDNRQIEALKANPEYAQATLVHANFADIAQIAPKYGFGHVQGILVDLGLSMSQITDSGKGLSFRQPTERLDMRMIGTGPSAADLLNEQTQSEIAEMLITNAEEQLAQPIARAIVAKRQNHPLTQVSDLLDVLDEVATESRQVRKEQMYARVFQALRIAVNNEIENLRRFLETATPLLAPKGRLVVITFHSLEDRIVKKWGRKHPELKIIPITIAKKDRRSFERSAQLRVFEKQ